jgi:transcriptional regulator with XRE-family HTH domain
MKNGEESRKIIASRLFLARQQAGLSQAQAAKLLGFSRPTITEIEAGRRKVAVEELVSLSDIYDASVEWLSGKDAEHADEVRDRLQLAARNMAGMKPEDLDRVIALLTSLKSEDNE